jgi:hypothetical protein
MLAVIHQAFANTPPTNVKVAIRQKMKPFLAVIFVIYICKHPPCNIAINFPVDVVHLGGNSLSTKCIDVGLIRIRVEGCRHEKSVACGISFRNCSDG